MTTPVEDWIIVQRPVREVNTKGTVVMVDVDKDRATWLAREASANSISYNYQAMPAKEY